MPSHTPYTALRLAFLLPLFALPLAAAPVAVNDTFNGSEDSPLSPDGLPILNAAFGADAEGFSYLDNTFGTAAQGQYAEGTYEAAGGFSSTGGLQVRVGNRPNNNGGARQSSGGWRRNITVTTGGVIQFSGRYRIQMLGGMETNEYGDLILDVGGTRYGANGTAPSLYLARLYGPNEENTGNNEVTDTGWQTFTQNVTLAAGSHAVTIGLYNNNSTAAGEIVQLNLDDLVVGSPPGSGSVLLNDTGGTGTVTAVKLTDPEDGAVVFNANGSFTYTPAPNFNGTDSFTYRAQDSTGNSNTATVTLVMAAVNDAPAAAADSFSGTEDGPLTVAAPGVLGNDSDVDNPLGQLSASVVTQPANGAVTMSSNGSFIYTPNLNFAGTDTFTYRVSDGEANSAPATVTITVNGMPDAPQGVVDSYKTYSGTPLVVNAATHSGSGSILNLIAAAPDTPSGGTAQPGDTWKYLDNGSDQGTAWREPVFDDSTWKTGRGEFGYGDAASDGRPEFTLIEDNPTPGYTAADTNRYITTYFRKTFAVEDWRKLTAPAMSLLRDDGVVVWLNGQRIYFENGLGSALYNTLTTGSIGNEVTHDTIALPNALPHLVDGDNVMAVEVHQQSQSSSDLSFDMGFSATERSYAGVLANDVEPDGQPMTAAVQDLPQHGSLTLNANGTFTYTPAAGYVGADSFTYRASDGALTSPAVTVNLTVAPPFNQAPTATANTYAATEDVTLSVNTAQGVLANDSDPEGAALTAVLFSNVANGVLTLNANGSFTYLSNLNYNGTDSFSYRAFDGEKYSQPVTVTLNIAAVGDVPLPVADTYRTLVGTPLTVNTTAPGGSSTLTLITAAPETTGGTAQPGDLWKYLDNGSDQGTAWQAIDFDDTLWKEGYGELGYGDEGEGRPEFTLIEDNPTPGYSSASDRFVTTYFRKTFGVADKSRLSAMNLSLLRDDGAVIWLNGTRIHADGALATANPLTYMTLADNQGNESTHETISIPAGAALLQDGPNVLAVEIHQNTRSSSDVSFDLGMTVTESSYAGVLFNDSDPEGNAFTAVLASQPANGNVILNTNGTFTYTPNAGYRGTDTFTYRAVDGSGQSAPATVFIIVSSGSNQKPTAVADTFAAVEDTVLSRSAALGVLANDTDPDGDTLTASLVNTTANGVLVLNADGSFNYTPALNFNGTDAFTYRAKDSGNLLSSTVTVTLNVGPANDAPAAANDSYGVNPGQTLSVPAAQGVLANDSDIDGDTLTAQLVAAPASGVLSLNANGGFSYTPADAGTFSFSYRASDGTAFSAVTTVTLIVNGQPLAAPDSFSVNEDNVLVMNAADGVLKNDTDPEGAALTAAVVSQPQHGTLSFAANGSFTYTPAVNFEGSDVFTYTVSDGLRTSAAGTVNLTVNPVNDAPVAVEDSFSVLKDAPLTVAAAAGVLKNDTDIEAGALAASLVTGVVNGSLTLNSDGSFTYTPLEGFTGEDSFTYRAGDSGGLFSPAVTVTLTVTEVADTIAISEIMFNPAGGNVAQEFIEIWNYGTFTVDVGGWQFTAGVDYTIPGPRTLAPGARLIIPADTAAFDAAWPGRVALRTPTGWGSEFSLSNSGENIRLERPDLASPGTFIEVDEVDYSDEGDWAVRQVETAGNNTGWAWNCPADGGGPSLQLRSGIVSNKYGQNWTSANGTPGAPNAAASLANLPPVILDVKHSPALPGPTEQVHITCEIKDELTSGHSVTVFYRLSTASPGAFTGTAMFDDGLHRDDLPGDGKWGAALPAQAAGSIVEFYVSANDGSASRNWPAPALSAAGAVLPQTSSANCFYMVNTEAWTGAQPIYRLIMSRPEGDAFVATSYDRGEGSDTDKNITVIFAQGSDTAIRYQGGVRYRGAGSRGSGYRPHNWKLSLPHDAPWGEWTSFNLNSLSAHSLVLGSRLMQGAGLPCEIGTPAAVRMNGGNRMVDGSPSGVAVYNLYSHQTPMGSEWADLTFPGDGGNLYKKGRGSGGGWQLFETSPGVPNISGYANAGWIKQTNATENDWTDLNDFFRTIRAATNNATSPPSFDYALASTVADLEQWARWWAFCVIVNHRETNLSNGVDDDYSLYIRNRDRRVTLLQHDFDTILSAGDTGTSATATIWQAYDTSFLSEKTFASAGLDIPRALFFNNQFVRRFKFHLRDLLGTVFTQPNFDALVDSTLGASAWVPQSERDRMKTFMNNRRAYITTQLPTAFTAATSLTVTNGYPSTTAADVTGLSGTMDGALTARVLVNGMDAVLNNHDNLWTAAGISAGLQPGLNTVPVQALDETGRVIAGQTFLIHYDDASVVTKGGTLAASETWSAAGGPYSVTSALTVPSGVTLTIQPGATVYFGSGIALNVTAGGRLIAGGTAQSPVRFTRAPGSGVTWNGITASGSPEFRLSHAVFEFTSGIAVRVQNGTTATLDRVTFLNDTRQSLQLDGSSFVVSDCSFPAAATGASFSHITGNGGIMAGGQGIIRDCTFGRTLSGGDAVNFAGVRRPGPILRVTGCTFDGISDDALDLRGADAWVEGNLFLHIHRGGSDTASAVCAGSDGVQAGRVTVLRNQFYDCDIAVTAKQGAAFALLYNTIARINKAGGTETQAAVVNLADTTDGTLTGAGGVVQGNVITDVESLTRQYSAALSSLTFSDNLLPLAWSGPGSGNLLNANAQLNLGLITAPATASGDLVRSALLPLAGSPVAAAGFGGNDLGATFPAGTCIAGVPLSVTGLNSATLTFGPAGSFGSGTPWSFGYTHYRFSTDGSTWSSERAISTPLNLTGLAAGVQTVQVQGKDDSGLWQTAPTTVSWTVNPALPTVVLSEVLADNFSAYALGSTRPDIIELHNYGPAAVSLAGFGLTDDAVATHKFTFPAGVSIPAGGYLAVMADSLPSQSGELHAGFGISAGGETLTLSNAAGAVVDSVTFGPQALDLSIARTGPRLTWTLASVSPGAANTAYLDLADPSAVRLNEWLAANDFIVEDDFVELYNTAAKPVNISGMILTDDFLNLARHLAAGDGRAHVIAPLSFLRANGFVAFLADGNTGSGADHLSFKLSSFHENLALATAAGAKVDQAVVSAAREDVSEGRSVDGGVATSFFTLPTPGFSNTQDLTAELPLRNALRITEILYNPQNSSVPEFIEFRNTGAVPLDLTGVRFTAGITFTFPAMTLAPGAYTVITSDAARFVALWPAITPAGVYSGRLDNAGEQLRYELAEYPIGILDFTFSDAWYPATDGQGASLQIVNAALAPAAWNERESWQAGAPSPGAATAFGVITGRDLRVTFPAEAVIDGTVFSGEFSPGSITVAWSKLSGPGSVSFTAPANADTNASFSAAGTYVLRLTATGPGPVTVFDDLTVVAEETYDTWAARTLVAYSSADRLRTADPDRDGLNNLAEYVLAGNPAVPDAEAATILRVENDLLTLEYRRASAADTNVPVTPEFSTDTAAGWSPDAGNIFHRMTSESGGIQTWQATLTEPLTPGQRRYLRLRIATP